MTSIDEETDVTTTAIRQLIVEPREITTQVDDSVEYLAHAVTASGDTAEVEITWSTTSGTIQGKGQGNAKGVYKGKKTGKHNVIATDTSGVVDTATVIVSEQAVARVDVEPSEAEVSVGSVLRFEAIPRDAAGQVLTGRQVTWTTSDAAVAVVSPEGVVTGVATGSAVVSATVADQTGSASLTVIPPGGVVLVGSGGSEVVSALEFGTARAGTDLDWRTLTIENRSGATATDLSLVFDENGGSGSLHFADYQFPGTGGSCDVLLRPGERCSVVVQFSPMQVGSINGVIGIGYHDGERAVSKALAEFRGSGLGDVIYAGSDADVRAGVGRLGPGVTLIIEDGQYGELNIDGVAGGSSDPAIVRSRSDGGAHFRNVDIQYASNLQLVGLQAGLGRDGIDSQVVDIKAANHLLLKRVTAHHAKETGNQAVIEISESTYVTLQDCAAWGSGRIQVLYYDSDFGIFRRVWGQHLHNDSDTWPRTVFAMYYGASSLIENSVATQAINADPGAGQIEGFKVNSRAGVRIPNNNTIRGNVAHDLQGPAYYTTGDYDFANTYFHNNVVVGPEDHYLDSAFDPDEQAVDTEVHQHTAAHTLIGIGRPSSESGGDGIAGAMTHSIFHGIDRAGQIDAVSWSLFEDVLDLPSSLENQNREVSGLEFNEAVFGRVGTHLVRPPSARGSGQDGADIGAEILFRYAEVDDPTPSDRVGTLTTIPLWPHPLEERVWRESGGTISITYESRDGRSGLRGIWRDREALRQAYMGR